MAPTVLKGLEHHAVFLLLLQICVLLAVARFLGEIMRKLRQPPVVGELLAGVFLGPSTFGLLFPELQSEIFPPVQHQADLLSVVTWLGVLFLLIVTGFETDIRLILQKGKGALLISAGGIIIPFSTGLGMGWMLPERFLADQGQRLVFSLFMAVAMSISAVPVIAKVLFDLKLVRRDIGQLTLAAAMTDDTIGWILLSVVAGLATRGSVDLGAVMVSVGAALAFLLFAFTAGGPVVGGVLSIVDRLGTGVSGQLSAVLVMAFGAAAFTQTMGIEAVLGAFVVGILARQARRFSSETAHSLEMVTVSFAAPIFFASAGLKVDVISLLNQETFLTGLLVLGIACIGKFTGCYLGAWVGGLSHWERLAVGSGMNARGAMEIIVATVGLGLGVLTKEMYSIIVMVAIVTSLMAPPLLRWTLSHVKMGREEANRLEREELAATSFARSLRRVLLVARGDEQARLVATLLADVNRVQNVEITAIYANLEQAEVSFWRSLGGESRRRLREFKTNVRNVRKAVQENGAAIELKIAGGENAAEIVLTEAAAGYDVVAVAVDRGHNTDGTLFGSIIDRVVRDAPCPALVVKADAREQQGATGAVHANKILVPVGGTEQGKHALEVACLLAQGANASLTILHVMTVDEEPLPGDALLEGRQRKIAEDLLEQHVALAKQFGIEPTGTIVEANSPETAIIEMAHSGGFDTVFLGASAHNVQLRTYLGRRVEVVLKETKCTVAVMCS
jgi:Kef-type K+ transport system membrane component KefB